MKQLRSILYIALACLAATVRAGIPFPATDATAIAIENWTTPSTPGAATAKVETIASPDGTLPLLRISYKSPARTPILLTPPAPVPLSDDLKNLSLWFARAEGDFSLLFNIRDAKGALHQLKVNTSRLPHGGPVGWQQHRAREWSVWSQATSYRINTPANIEERTLPEFQDATRALAWPRPLSLAGLVIKPAKTPAYDALGAGPAVKAGSGSLLLSPITAITKNGFEADWSWTLFSRCRQGRDTPPVLFLDDLTVADEDIHYEITLHHGYQGPVLWSQRGAGSSDRKIPDTLFRQRIQLPELPRGRYFLNTKAWKPDGTLIEERQFLELIVIQNRTLLPPPPLPGRRRFPFAQ